MALGLGLKRRRCWDSGGRCCVGRDESCMGLTACAEESSQCIPVHPASGLCVVGCELGAERE